MSCTYTSMYSFIVYLLWLIFLYVDFCRGISSFCSVLNIFFKGLNWFYYILSKTSDLHCQQVIFSKSQVKSQVMDSKSKSSPKSMREVASQVTSHKNSDSSRTRVQVTWFESTSLTNTRADCTHAEPKYSRDTLEFWGKNKKTKKSDKLSCHLQSTPKSRIHN